MTTYAHLEKLVNDFDFSTLYFGHFGQYRKCPVFYNSTLSTFEVWVIDTDIETAESQSSVVYVGHLSQYEARNGKKPFIKGEKERIMMHITKEIC